MPISDQSRGGRSAACEAPDSPVPPATNVAFAPGGGPAARGGERRLLLYVLHSGHLFGTERMALYTVSGLADEFQAIIFAPPGPALVRAAEMGIAVRPFRSNRQLLMAVHPFLRRHRSFAFVATGVKHSVVFMALNLLYNRKVVHVHMVHGGAGELQAYGRKSWLNWTGVTFVAVSEFVRQRLIDYGVRSDKVRVVSNFLLPERIASFHKRPAFTTDGIRNVVVISRLDPIKRVGLLLDALDLEPRLRELSFKVLGLGPELGMLRDRAKIYHPNVRFVGLREEVAADLAEADLLLHTCPEEPFGLVLLEAMAADVPVLVPDYGGPDFIVQAGVSGFKFHANDAADLAARLRDLIHAPAESLNRAVAGGRTTVNHRFAAHVSLREYRKIFRPWP